MPNRLANETSPYLLQHADNPVDWYAWGAEALERARLEDKPILLSIGYAACHWCHVMEHESFEDETTASMMNELFVNVKVDREERPDLDAIYMQAVQAMTGHGGWPMTVFLTPDGQPFYGGTYYPPEDRQGMPGFRRILTAVADAYRNKREAVDNTTEKLREIYDVATRRQAPAGELSPAVLEGAYRSLGQSFDMDHAGFGGAPKFPPSMSLDFLLRYWTRTGTEFARDMAVNTFRAMARGGIYDQVGGGLHRYSVDERWLVPHFEKMLYDNALLVRLGVHLWQETKDPEIRRVTQQTLGWLAREMTAPDGGFYSSLDADSEGHEGKFYVWDAAELDASLGESAALVKSYWGVTPEGNFEGKNILNVRSEPSMIARRAGVSEQALEQAITKASCTLYGIRSKRTWPERDEKVLASWNGLMLRAVAEAARVFGDPQAKALALRNGEFLRDRMVSEGRVVRSYKNGTTKAFGFLEDHAAVGLGFLELYALTFDAAWLDAATAIADSAVARFRDPETGLFFDTPADHEALITRPRDVTDNAIPSGTSLVADLLLRLAVLAGRADLGRTATDIVRGVAEPLSRYPSAFGHLLGVADMAVFGATEVALVGDPQSPDFARLYEAVGASYVPSLVLAGGAPAPESPLPLLHGREAREGLATAYVCRGYACDVPTTSPDELSEQLARAAGAPAPVRGEKGE